MPPPFETRPRLGSRILVQANFGMTLHALCNELAAWQVGAGLGRLPLGKAHV